jgi:membrane-bound lytic murein transglycosylase B
MIFVMKSVSALAAVLAVFLMAPAAIAHETPSEDAGFDAWLGVLRAEAEAQGIRHDILDAAFDGVTPIARIIELDRKQPEFTQTFAQYMENRITPKLAEEGRRHFALNKPLLEKVARKFRVQPRFIVALWGVETRYGTYTGGFPVIAALATLAYDGRRSDYFRGELLKGLIILDEGHIAPADMMGSWAGAMGQSQFMPSSFLNFAVDFDGDNRRDIWTTQADVFASAANYLARSGWRDDQTWGREVMLPDGFDPALAGLDVVKRLSVWQKMGVRRADGSDLPTRDLEASVVLPGGEAGPAFVVYSNYRTILKWNRSHYFAMSVGRLADLIGNR